MGQKTSEPTLLKELNLKEGEVAPILSNMKIECENDSRIPCRLT